MFWKTFKQLMFGCAWGVLKQKASSTHIHTHLSVLPRSLATQTGHTQLERTLSKPFTDIYIKHSVWDDLYKEQFQVSNSTMVCRREREREWERHMCCIYNMCTKWSPRFKHLGRIFVWQLYGQRQTAPHHQQYMSAEYMCVEDVQNVHHNANVYLSNGCFG